MRATTPELDPSLFRGEALTYARTLALPGQAHLRPEPIRQMRYKARAGAMLRLHFADGSALEYPVAD